MVVSVRGTVHGGFAEDWGVVRAVLLLVISGVFEIALEAIGLVEDQLGGAPVCAHEIRLVVYSVLVAGMCERGNLCEDLNAACGEAKEAVDCVVIVLTFQIGFKGQGLNRAAIRNGTIAPVVTCEKRFFISSAR
jgi:hypothetical protein